MGTRQRSQKFTLPLVRTPRHLQNVWWVYFVARMGIEGAKPCKLGHVLAHDMLTFLFRAKLGTGKFFVAPRYD